MFLPKTVFRNKSTVSFVFTRGISTNTCKQYVGAKGAYDAEGKTRVDVIDYQRYPDLGLLIQSYSQVGFRLNSGLKLFGPLVLFARSVLSWDVGGPYGITVDSLSLFTKLEPKLDILVLGIGDSLDRKPHIEKILMKDFIKKHNINVEILRTDHACTTYNFLCMEHRLVAGAFLPPQTIVADGTDVINTRIHYDTLLKTFDDEPEKEDLSVQLEKVVKSESFKRSQKAKKEKIKKEHGRGASEDTHH